MVTLLLSPPDSVGNLFANIARWLLLAPTGKSSSHFFFCNNSSWRDSAFGWSPIQSNWIGLEQVSLAWNTVFKPRRQEVFLHFWGFNCCTYSEQYKMSSIRDSLLCIIAVIESKPVTFHLLIDFVLFASLGFTNLFLTDVNIYLKIILPVNKIHIESFKNLRRNVIGSIFC